MDELKGTRWTRRILARQRDVPFRWMYFLLCFLAAATCNAQRNYSAAIPYQIPAFGMKLIVLEDGNFSLSSFKNAMDKTVHNHLDSFLESNLPSQSGDTVLNQESFVSVALDSTAEMTPVDLKMSDGIPLLVVRVSFTGVGRFYIESNVSSSSAENSSTPINSTFLVQYIENAFSDEGGFEDLSESIRTDEVLSSAGKLQIVVGDAVVAEGIIVEEEDNEDSVSNGVVATLCIVFILFAFFVAGVLYCLYLRHIEKELERMKQKRREASKQLRIKNTAKPEKDGKINETYKTSIDLEDSWMDDQARRSATVSDRLARPNQSTKQRLHSRPALEAKKANDSLLHCIAEGSSDSEDSARGQEGNESNDTLDVFGNRIKEDQFHNDSNSCSSPQNRSPVRLNYPGIQSRLIKPRNTSIVVKKSILKKKLDDPSIPSTTRRPSLGSSLGSSLGGSLGSFSIFETARTSKTDASDSLKKTSKFQIDDQFTHNRDALPLSCNKPNAEKVDIRFV